MSDIVKSEGTNIIGMLHQKGGLELAKPFERDIYLFDSHVAGTTHIEGMEELEPFIKEGDRLEFYRELKNSYDPQAIV